MEWRAANNVDTILTDYVFKEADAVMECYPRGFFGTDKQGRPLYIDRTGKINPTKLLSVSTWENFEKSYIQSYELMLKKQYLASSLQNQRQISRNYSIVDLDGYTYTESMANRGFLNKLTQIT